jgi:hypothetical protein
LDFDFARKPERQVARDSMVLFAAGGCNALVLGGNPGFC